MVGINQNSQKELKKYEAVANYLYRTDLRYYTPQAFKAIRPSTRLDLCWYHDYMAWLLMRTLPLTPSVPDKVVLNPTPEHRIRKLIINIPPRHLKTTYINAFKTFLLGNYPHERMITATYSGKAAQTMSIETRQMLDSLLFAQNFSELSLDKDSEAYFSTTARGSHRVVSTEGTVTSMGGNYLFIDDPTNPDEANSKHQLEKSNYWYQNTYFSRLDEPRTGVIILVMQRLHQNDLSGMLLEMNRSLPEEERWHHVDLPVIASEDKTYHYFNKTHHQKKGDILTPQRYDSKMLESWKIEKGTYTFNSQYLMRPSPEGGGIIKIKWMPSYTNIPKPIKNRGLKIVSIDTGSSVSRRSDPTAILTFLYDPQDKKSYLIKSEALKKEYPDLKKHLIEYIEKEKPDSILIENKDAGRQLIQELSHSHKYPIIKINPVKSKELRVEGVTPQLEQGKLSIPTFSSLYYHPDVQEFLDECENFPYAKHDDRVDALSQYMAWSKNREKKRHIRITTFSDANTAVESRPLEPIENEKEQKNEKQIQEQENSINPLLEQLL